MRRPIDEQVWHRMTAEIMSGMREWREAHPKATLREMEQELDHRWVRVRARMLEDMALASVAADWTTTPAGQQPGCTSLDGRRHHDGSYPAVGHRHLQRPRRDFAAAP